MAASGLQEVSLNLRKPVGFLIAFFWDGLDWAYHMKDTLPGDISLPDKNDVIYTVTKDEPVSSHMSLGVKVALKGG